MQPIPTYDELHVVSDLHMGGETGFQIFDQGKLLAQLIEHLRAESPAKQVALLINGDMVDFLAEPNPQYFDPHNAIEKLERISADPAFEPVWTALANFVNTKNRTLAVNLGNHDLELAVPWVREWFLNKLCGGKTEVQNRIMLVLDGTGFRCRVGKAQVVGLHGNEVDDWNFCDYESLRRQARDFTLGLNVKPWTPNAGTKIVIDVMNKIKKRFAFVDLLKPETGAVVPTLYALDPTLKPSLGESMGIAGKMAKDKVLRWAGFLGEDDEEPARVPTQVHGMQALEAMLGDTFGSTRGEGKRESETKSRLLIEAERNLAEGRSPMELVDETADGQKLGVMGAAIDWVLGKDKSEVLRQALERLTTDQSFELDHRDQTFKDLDDFVSDHIDFVVAGHTHHERAIPRRAGGGFYYNSGTWVRLIRLAPDVLKSPKDFAKVFKVFEQGTMDALDKAKVLGKKLVDRCPGLVSIIADGSVARACIHRVRTVGGKIKLDPVENSKFERR